MWPVSGSADIDMATHGIVIGNWQPETQCFAVLKSLILCFRRALKLVRKPSRDRRNSNALISSGVVEVSVPACYAKNKLVNIMPQHCAALF